MPRVGILLLAALLISAIVALFFWPDPASEAVSPTEIHADSSAPTEANPDEASTDDAEAANRTVIDPASASPEEPAFQPAYEGEDGFVIRVVKGADKVPVADADVFVLSSDMPEYAMLNRSSGRDWTAYNTPLRNYGLNFRTDGDGLVRIPPNGDYRRISVEKGDAYAAAFPHWNTEEVEVELIPNLRLEVHVRGVDGLPQADVPVELLLGEEGYGTRFLMVKTNGDGVAWLEGLRKHFDRARNYNDVYVGLGFPMETRNRKADIQFKLTEEMLEQGPLTFVMPETCSLTVRVFDSSGELCTEEGGLSVYGDFAQKHYSETRVYRRTETGIAEFPLIGPELDLVAKFGTQSSKNDDLVEFRSPAAGEHLVVDLHRAAKHYIVGRLVDEKGQPLAEQTLRYYQQIRSEQGGTGLNDHSKTDEQGRFRHEFLFEAEDGKVKSRTLTLRIMKKGEAPKKRVFEIPAEPPQGDHDLGDVYLPEQPFVVSGVVKDQAGNSIEDARVSVHYPYQQIEERVYWSAATDEKDDTNAEGEFFVYGEVQPSHRYRLTVSASGYEQQHVEFALGSDDIEVTMLRPQTLHGSVLLGRDWKSGDVGCRIRDSKSHVGWGRLTATKTAGKFNFSIKVEPGMNYSVQFQTNLGETITQIDGIVIGNDAETRPPALQDIDLRDQAKWLKLRICNADGDLLPAVMYATLDHRGTGRSVSPSGEYQTLIVEGFTKMTIASEGYATQALENLSESQTVVLQRAIPVTFHIDEGFTSRDDVDLYLATPADRGLGLGRGTKVGKKGQLLAHLPSLGPHEITVSLWMSSVGSAHLAKIQCEVTHENQEIHLLIGQDTYNQAIQTLEARKQ